MGNMLDNPITDKVHCQSFTTSEGLAGGATGMQGWRLEMEDAHILCDIPSAPMHSLLAVFDGHGGSGAAKYAAEHLLAVIESTAEWREYVDGNFADISKVEKACDTAFLKIDEDIRVAQEKSDTGEPGQADTSGCTAVVCIISEKYIVCSNAGDSRCVMGSAGETKALSEDHKPDNTAERARISEAGGYVSANRVEGNLAVSRAFGDFEFKEEGRDPRKTKVTAEPEVRVHERLPSDDILILACDGVWDVFTNEDVIDTARIVLNWGETNMQYLAEEIVDSALGRGSKDNISCVALKLPGAKIGDTSQGGVLAKRRAREIQKNKALGLNADGTGPAEEETSQEG